MFLVKRQGTTAALRTALALPFVLLLTASVMAQNPSTYINVDANANRRPINPSIYGVAYATTANLADLNFVINRIGGNNVSRYNWKLNADNKGSDWYFESIGDSSSTPAERIDSFVLSTFSANVSAEPMITIPMIGYVAKLGTNRSKLASYSIKKYGAQTGSDWQWFADAGNGILSATGKPITTNNPLDANVAADSTFQQGLVQHLVTTFGTSANKGVKYYIYDNEPSIWQSTHRDVKPTGPTMDEIKNKIIDYGTKIRAADPGAILVGPEEWGWSGYFYSGYDQQYGNTHGWGTLPDRANHANWDYLPWLLDQLNQYQKTSGKRLLDVFTVHYYPQGGEFGNDTSTAMQQRRNRSTRSLWDPKYTDETWISSQVQLIPRIKGWVNQYYPGTKTGITEYNWGAEGHINGATTQADILGIFGREGLDLSARWATPDPSTPTYKAMKLYRNYDGNKSTFGDTSVAATVANPDNLSAFAAVRSSDKALTVIAVNKSLTGSTPVSINMANFATSGPVQIYQLTSANVISRLANLTVTSNAIVTTVPAQSVTLFVVPASGAVTPPSYSFASVATPKPATLAPNATTTINIKVTNTGSAIRNLLTNMEIYNSAGVKVYQQFATGQNFALGQIRYLNWNWTPTVAGTYTVKVGVFSSNWSTVYHWNDKAGTIIVK